MYLSILLLPLLGGILGVNRFAGNKGPIISTIIIGITTILSYIAFYEVGLNHSFVVVKLGTWLSSSYLNIEWSFIFDTLTVSMFIPVMTVSFLVQLYSLSYMDGDPSMNRFFSYLSLFSFFMLILVTGENFLILFVGWEFVGLISYLLVNFWFTRLFANMAALKAFLLNRIGDMFLASALLFLITVVGDLSFSTIFSLTAQLNSDLIFIISLLIILGALTKSGQIGMSIWLLSAMEGPTPVSALLHAATMVTAGVFLLIKMSPMIEYSSTSLIIIIWIGGISALFGASGGIMENDIKKIIAYSTTSQLGYMFVMIGLSQYNLALFHLINHSWFKALLFLTAGAIIHAVSDEQDIRKMGGLILLLPKSYSFVLLGSLSLMAFPFLTGFYSKDFLLEIILVPYNFTHTIAYLMTYIAAILTATYSIRLLILTFISEPNFNRSNLSMIYDPPILMFIPLIILSFGATFLGYITNELFLGMGSQFYQNTIFIHPNHIRILDGSNIPSTGLLSIFKYLPLLILLLLITLLPITSHKGNNRTITNSHRVEKVRNLSIYTNGLSHFNIYSHHMMANSLIQANILSRYIDRGIFELIGPTGIIRLFHYIAFSIELLATGFISHYAFIIVGVVSLSFILGTFVPFILIIIILWGILNLFRSSSISYFNNKSINIGHIDIAKW